MKAGEIDIRALNASPWIYDALIESLEGASHVTNAGNFSMEFDRWYWGGYPAVIRRGEIVIERETEGKMVFPGIRRVRPIVSMKELEERLASNPGCGELVATAEGLLIFQRFHGFSAWDSLYGTGIGEWPTLDHVEVRENPVLQQLLMSRIGRNMTFSVYRPPIDVAELYKADKKMRELAADQAAR